MDRRLLMIDNDKDDLLFLEEALMKNGFTIIEHLVSAGVLMLFLLGQNFKRWRNKFC